MGDMADYYLSQEDPFDPLGTYWQSPEPEGEHPPMLRPTPTKTIWVTREGERIRVRDMTDSHLVNTIRYLRRVGALELAEGQRLGYSILGMLQGEMAIDSVERDLDRLESQTVDEYLHETRPTFEAMLAEAERRNLPTAQPN